MSDKRFSVVIPAVGRHDKFLPKLISDLRNEDNLIGEVIVVRSGLNSNLYPLYRLFFYILRLILRPGFEVKVVTSSIKRTAGQNRNTGWKTARFEFTAFLDADDLYHQNRLTAINELLHLHPNANLILNLYSFSNLKTTHTPLMDHEIVSDDSIQGPNSEAFEKEIKDWEVPGLYNLTAVGKSGESLKIQHGHATVRTELKDSIQYLSIPKGEDGLFASEVLIKQGQVFIILRELSFYRNFNSSFAPNIFKKKLIRTRDTLNTIFRK
ncbi:Glyco_tranf_GTA_type domain containing protein [Candidatus Nanopelagicaceae bacterium]